MKTICEDYDLLFLLNESKAFKMAFINWLLIPVNEELRYFFMLNKCFIVFSYYKVLQRISIIFA